ncbi:MAG: type II secretion system protein [Verrucomicrobiota bacterium]
MKNSRAFTLIELMAVVVMTIMICSLLVMTFESLQKSISISRRNLTSVVEAEFILQTVQQDLRSMVSSRLSSPIRYSLEGQILDLFLCNEKGYQGERCVSLIGYELDRRSKGARLLRYARSIGWDDSFFGVTSVLRGNALDASAFRLTPQLLKSQEEELSNRVIDFTLYYHYFDSKNNVLWISREPLNEGYKLQAITVSFVVSNLFSLGVNEFVGIEDTPQILSRRERRSGSEEGRLPWFERFDEVNLALGKIKDKRIVSQHFFRTVEIEL